MVDHPLRKLRWNGEVEDMKAKADCWLTIHFKNLGKELNAFIKWNKETISSLQGKNTYFPRKIKHVWDNITVHQNIMREYIVESHQALTHNYNLVTSDLVIRDFLK